MHNSRRPDAVLEGSTRCLDSSQRHLMLDSDVPEFMAQRRLMLQSEARDAVLKVA